MRTLNASEAPVANRYEVTGKICCWLKPNEDEGYEPTQIAINALAQAIKDADSEHPWYVSAGADRERPVVHGTFAANWRPSYDGPETPVVWFSIIHERRTLRRAQVYAYEKYLATLALAVAQCKPPGVEAVSADIEIHVSSLFKV